MCIILLLQSNKYERFMLIVKLSHLHDGWFGIIDMSTLKIRKKMYNLCVSFYNFNIMRNLCL